MIIFSFFELFILYQMMEETTKSKRVLKFRTDVVYNSEKYTTEMTDKDKYKAYQGWALKLKGVVDRVEETNPS